MKFCQNCGVSVDDQQKYCRECGARLEEINLTKQGFSTSDMAGHKKTVKTMNTVSLCLMVPYIAAGLAFAFTVVMGDTLAHGIGYASGFLWPVLFEVVLFVLARSGYNADYCRKRVVNIHLIISIIFVGALVLGGFIMLVLTYGLVVLPFASGVLHIIIGYKTKKLITE